MAVHAYGADEIRVFVNDAGPFRGGLSINRDRIDVTSDRATKPDPTWEHVDAAGHWHAWSDREEDRLPTLVARTTEMPCNGSCGGACGGEGYTRTDHYCLICDELIEPAVLPDTAPKSIPGPESWEVTVHAAVPDGEVSVRVEFRPGAVEEDYFGVAKLASAIHRGDGDGGLSVTSTLVGCGPLGGRKRRAAAAAR